MLSRSVYNLLKCTLNASHVLSRCICGIRVDCTLNTFGNRYGNETIQKRYYRKELSCPPITVTSPELLLYWHPTKNNGISPENVTIKSFRKVWWKCPKGVDHEWLNCVRYVVDKNGKYTGCPFCNNKRVSVTNSLSTKCPELASQWHPALNGSLLPSDVTYTSSKNVWWQCDKDPTHVWKRPVNQRVNPRTNTQGILGDSV